MLTSFKNRNLLQENPVLEELDLSEFVVIKKSPEVEAKEIITKEIIKEVYIPGKDGIDGKTPIKNVDYFDGKDGITPIVKINEVKLGKVPLIENVSTSPNELLLNFTLPEGVEGKPGKNGYTPQKGIDYNDGLNGKDGNSVSIKINETIIGEEAKVINKGTSTDLLLDFIIPKAKDGYTPIKGKDYFDAVAPTISIGNVFEGTIASVNNIGDDKNLLLDFVIPRGKEGKQGERGRQGDKGDKGDRGKDGKDGRNGKDGIDGKDGKNGSNGLNGKAGSHGYTPIKGKDYFDGKDGVKGDKGDVPNHEIDIKGNIRFELPSGKWGEWIQIASLVESISKQYASKYSGNNVYGGGGSNLDFIFNGNVYLNKKYLQLDESTLNVEVVNDDTLKISSKGGSGASVTFKKDKFLTSISNRSYVCSFAPTVDSEFVILNGVVLTEGDDYTLSNKTITLDNSVPLKNNMKLIVRYTI